MNIRIFLAVIALLVSACAWAGPEDTFTLVPSVVPTGQAVQLQVDSPDGCYPSDNLAVSQSAGVIAVEFTLSDVSPCMPTWATPRLLSIGTFASGSYEVRVTECTNVPINPCTLRQTLQLTVGGGVPAAAAVPTLSQVGVMLLALALVGFANKRMRA